MSRVLNTYHLDGVKAQQAATASPFFTTCSVAFLRARVVAATWRVSEREATRGVIAGGVSAA
jgi:hypothetical protein